MRKLLTILILAGIMVALLQFDFGSAQLPFEPKSLAATGFILLAAYTIGEVVQRLGPPKVVGYIFAGVLFGPYLAPLILGEGTPSLFSEDVVRDLSLINGLAQGLIGLTAGGELILDNLKRDAKSILTNIGFHTLFVTVAVGAGVAGLAFLYPPALPFLESPSHIIAAALLFGTIAVGTSPSTTLAVVTETKAKGPLTNLTLGLIVAKDISTVTIFLLAIAVASILVSGGTFSTDSLLLIGQELGGAIALGFVFGVVIWLYLRFIKAEMMLFIVAVVFVGQWIAVELHIEALLMFMVAGFLVQNNFPGWVGSRVSRFFVAQPRNQETKDPGHDLGHKMIHELERVSLPVFVVFFTIAAARLELAALADFWIVVTVYIVFRAVALYLGVVTSNRIAYPGPAANKYLWLVVFPQAGVTVALTNLLDGKVPWFEEFGTIIVGTILVDIVVGPTLAKIALGKARETADTRGDVEQADQEVARSDEADEVLQTEFVESEFASPVLAEQAGRIRVQLRSVADAVETGFLKARSDGIALVLEDVYRAADEALADTARRLDKVVPDTAPDAMEPWTREELATILRQGRAEMLQRVKGAVDEHRHSELTPEQVGETYSNFLKQIEDVVESAEEAVVVEQEADRFAALPGDGRTKRAIKALKRIARAVGLKRTRTVPVRVLARFYVELPMPNRLLAVANMMGMQRRHMWREARDLVREAEKIYLLALAEVDHDDDAAIVATSEPSTEEGLIAMFTSRQQGFTQLWHEARAKLAAEHERVASRLLHSLAVPYAELIEAMRLAGTFELTRHNFEAARLFDDYRKTSKGVVEAVGNWAALNAGKAGALLLEIEVAQVQTRLRQILVGTHTRIDEDLHKVISYWVDELGQRTSTAHERIANTLKQEADPEVVTATISKERGELVEFIEGEALSDLNDVREAQRYADVLDSLLLGLRGLTNTTVEEVAIATPEMLDQAEAQPMLEEEVELVVVPLRAVLRESLEREVAARLADVELRMETLLESATGELHEIGQSIGFNLDAAAAELQEPSEDMALGRGRETAARLRTDDGLLTQAGLLLPREFALEGLDRTAQRLQALRRRVTEEVDDVKDEVRAETVKQIREVREFVEECSAASIRKFLAQRQLSAASNLAAERSRGLFRRMFGLGQLAYDRLLRPLKIGLIDDLSRRFGFAELRQIDHPADLIAAVDDVWARPDLPSIYRRLFSPSPIDLPDFFIDRPQALSVFGHAVESWSNQAPCAIAIIGEPGAGRTSFVDQALRIHAPEIEVGRRQFSRAVRSESLLADELASVAGGRRDLDIEQIVAKVRSTKARTVVVVEGAENLFLRSMDGLATMRRFVDVMARTERQLLWVVNFDRHAYRYLHAVTGLGDQFTHKIELQPMSRDQIEELIVTRHKVSGYGLQFADTLVGLQRLRLLLHRLRRPTLDQQQLIRRTYFDHLQRISNGSPLLAIYHWLQSAQIEEGNGEPVIRAMLPRPSRLPVLDKLDTHKLLLLANLILHDGLTLAEYCEVFRIDEKEAKATLRLLTAYNLIYRDAGAEDTYRIHSVLYQSIAERLRAQNML